MEDESSRLLSGDVKLVRCYDVQKRQVTDGWKSRNRYLTSRLCRPALVMQPMRYRLAKIGCDARIWACPTLFRLIGWHARKLIDYLRALDVQGIRYAIVVHSMSAIVTRAALNLSTVTRLR